MIRSRTDLADYLRQDREAYGLRRWRSRFRLTRRTLYFTWLLRRAEYWRNCRPDPLGKAMYLILRTRVQLLGERLGLDIPLNVFGPGLRIPHFGSIVVNHRTRVGARCVIMPGVLLGDANGKAPTIGDDVYLGPGVIVIGADIGDHVGARAGAVVVKDVPSGASVAGVPAIIVGEHRPEELGRRGDS